jgi:hypothetical protein
MLQSYGRDYLENIRVNVLVHSNNLLSFFMTTCMSIRKHLMLHGLEMASMRPLFGAVRFLACARQEGQS